MYLYFTLYKKLGMLSTAWCSSIDVGFLQCHKPLPIIWWFIAPIYGKIGDSLLIIALPTLIIITIIIITIIIIIYIYIHINISKLILVASFVVKPLWWSCPVCFPCPFGQPNADHPIGGRIFRMGHLKKLLKMTIYSGFSHWKWGFSIVMLVYQRVDKF